MSTGNSVFNRIISAANSVRRPRPSAAFLAAVGVAFTLALPAATSAHDEPAYTGIVIDARHLPAIDRSPAPVIYNSEPTTEEVYPDPKCVPTPDEVQEASVVRYYHTEDEAEKGVVGNHPLVIKAVEVVGPAHDSLRITAEDATQLKELDKTMHFTRTWKVGFLIPENR